MKNKLLSIINLCLFLSISSCLAQNKSKHELDFRQIIEISKAIKVAEGSETYGIKSIKLKGKTESEKREYAKQICLNTISNNFIRFKKQSQQKDFITFLGSRYAPIGVTNDPNNLNKNWIKNVKSYLGKDFCNQINNLH